jgi:OOP family OmpA-OmpF porin
MEFLAKKEGIDAARMAAKGWGVEKPIAPNDTEEGREKNRRVEFLVIEQDVTAKKVEIDPSTGKERVVEEKKETLKAPEAAESAKPEAPAAGASGAKKPEPKKATEAKKGAEPPKAAESKKGAEPAKATESKKVEAKKQ